LKEDKATAAAAKDFHKDLASKMWRNEEVNPDTKVKRHCTSTVVFFGSLWP